MTAVASTRLPRWVTAKNLIIGFIALGFILRLTALGARPLHHDESLDAWFSWKFLNGTYDGYDPVYHGPLRFYITAAVFWLFGESETTARLLAAVSGAVLVAMPWLWRKDLGRVGVVAAIGLVAISPSMVYFSRVGREDSFFLTITFVTVLTLVSFLRNPKRWHPMVILTTLVAGMAVKESAFLTIFIFGGFMMVIIAQDFLVAPGRVLGRPGKPEDAPDPDAAAADSDRPELADEEVRSLTTDQTVAAPHDPVLVQRWSLVAGLVLMIAAFFWGEPIFRSLGVYGVVLFAFMSWAIYDASGRNVDFAEVRTVKSILAVGGRWWFHAIWMTVAVFVILFTQFLTDFSGPGSPSAPHGALRNGLTAGFEYWRGEQDTVRGDARWQYYLAVIPAYEWFILSLSAIGIGRVIRRPTLVGQTLVWWGIASFTVHSWAGERMPWLIIHPLFPLVVLAGLGVQSVVDTVVAARARRGTAAAHAEEHTAPSASMPWWVAPGAIFAILGMVWTLNTTYQANYNTGGEPQELYVQAGQATPEVPEWTERLHVLDRLMMAEEGRHISVAIDSDVYWPYGWYLRDFPVGTYAVFDENTDAPTADVVFLPHWDQAIFASEMTGYRALPYEHRWWWVPDFAVSPAKWARWLWDRTPWEGTPDDPSDCPGSVVGEVYIIESLAALEERYIADHPPEVADKPDYGGPCERQ